MVTMAYDPRKAAQTVAFFALKAGGTISVLKAMKLVYLADRQHISRTGFPVLDERRVSMDHGPVNSSTYAFVNGEQEDSGWSEFVSDRANHDLGLARPVTEADLDELSDAEVATLEHVWRQFGAFGKYELRDWTHRPENIPEWQDPAGSSWSIPLERIMEAVGLSPSQAQVVRDIDGVDTVLRSI